MDIEALRIHCLALPHVEESFPFDQDTLVFKVGGKIFAIMSLETHEPKITLKCDPDRAQTLRIRYEGVVPAFHMNKKHWNTVDAAHDVPASLVRELISHAYELVVNKLPMRIQAELKTK